MNKIISLIIILSFVGVFSLEHEKNWAVLVAGSSDFWNYRHQADVYHAYQILTKKGMDPNHIIVFATDDIA